MYFRSGQKSVPLDCLAGLHPVSISAAGTIWSPGYCSSWQGHVLAGLKDTLLPFKPSAASQEHIASCSAGLFLFFGYNIVHRVPDKSFHIRETLKSVCKCQWAYMTCYIFKGAGSENQSECVHCRQVVTERKPVMGRGKLHVMMILVRMVLIGGGSGGGKDKNKPQNPKTNKNPQHFDYNTCNQHFVPGDWNPFLKRVERRNLRITDLSASPLCLGRSRNIPPEAVLRHMDDREEI